ncbi:site-specific integrase [Neobacillus sp. PS3-12]|uniref:tyrosine-type recombinase/integrase n=1 Tax=Neobacillus sp. PS3-12 TaxID=3070677 RepID=UPI0027E023A5|nr:site-specific integrase [Neobacillus sp. PS3-12]WML52196.1 site-specific integrase [Neobacillus sp. PS3-12]
MKNLIEEINLYHKHSSYSSNYKNKCKKRLDDFLCYLAKETSASPEEVHLEKIYEKVNNGKTYFFYSLDVSLIDQYFLDHLHKSYNWLDDSKRALQSFFLYLYRKYDFPILTDEMNFNIEDHKQKPQKKEKYVPTRHDLLKFLQSLIKKSSYLERDLLFFLLLMTTGSRSSEILNTKVNEIDFVNETIYRKQTKNKTSKFIVLRAGFGKVLQKYVAVFNLKDDDYLINHKGKKMNINEFQEAFEFFLQDANLPFSTLHKLRHSFATMMAESGAGIFVIQQLLGHKKIHSTKTYIGPNYIRNNGMELQVNKEVYKHIKLRSSKN